MISISHWGAYDYGDLVMVSCAHWGMFPIEDGDR